MQYYSFLNRLSQASTGYKQRVLLHIRAFMGDDKGFCYIKVRHQI
jgi:hypothetical protein